MDHLTPEQRSRAIWTMIGAVLLVVVGLVVSGALIACNPQNLLWASLIVVSLPGMAFTIYASALKDTDRSFQTLTLSVLTGALVISALSVTSAAIAEKDFVPTAVVTVIALLVSAWVAFRDRPSPPVVGPVRDEAQPTESSTANSPVLPFVIGTVVGATILRTLTSRKGAGDQVG